ncbi:g6f-like isoform X2 [Xiphias gladius]|uniref:g6f-like isoform X2 n=1 Tax=Xiphias gladius TaxID=8245 RepID=UPI001A99FAEF|nr:g6f-like isoform X2 [Xiphias gladius]
MESGFLTFILVSLFAVYSSHSGITDWNDVVVAREGMVTTLVCTDRTVRGAVSIKWKVKSHGADEWKLILSASEKKTSYYSVTEESMRQTDLNFREGVFSLVFFPKMEDGGLYSCLIEQQERNMKKMKIILLAILTVTVIPSPVLAQLSTLQLIASVNPVFAITKITWEAPGGIPMKSEQMPNASTVAKLPLFQNNDSGVYVCMVHPLRNSSTSLFMFSVNVTVDAKLCPITDVTHGPDISIATQAHTSFPLTCAGVQGDYVRLHWNPPDTKKQTNMRVVHQYDRWRHSTSLTEQSERLKFAGPPSNAEAGNFSFLLTPEIKDGGLYICDVYLNDKSFSQRTVLSVLKVKTTRSSSKLELVCQYSERSQVKSVIWEYQNKSRRLKMSSTSPGRITTNLPLPITSDTAGNYTCTLVLKNGKTIWATQAVILPLKGGRDEIISVTTPSLFPLLLLVPLVAVAVGLLLWRQKHISDRGIEHSLSVHSGEAQNIYENPEDIRQAPLQGSVYMDLKPRGEDDVYKELERYEQCQS